ncbi:lipid phosphate phosphatase epsilon 1, chloroplastic-like [Elaeis guineensis]|uniref:Lipid phosphate phosphatase epsilon 1, chloroplastic-like n=1 Tax=Elaeis guineensis var. tenera TaxID=51953 RepID=A0A6I9SBB9_ELAGV|nr:lipid phosphate phosphatase epsilon 1, chloroplastic-like [Elaeis guineensis]
MQSPALHPPLIKTLMPIWSHRLPALKNPILMQGIRSKSHLDVRLRISKSPGMMELAGADAFKSRNGVEGGGVGEIPGNRPLRFQSSINRMSKWLVAGVFGLIVLWKHDAPAMWAAMGSVINAWLSVSLKWMLNHPRPDSALRSDPGMPSSHAQSIFYSAFVAVLSLVNWLGINLLTVTVGIVTLTTAGYLSWLRVSQQLHTVGQVLVGAVVGSTCSITWLWMWHSFVLKAFISSILVRILVVLSSVTFCMAFLLYVALYWLRDKQ